MNSKSITVRLLWKQYRLQRAFWISIGLLGILLQLLGAIVRYSTGEQLYWLFSVALGIPAFYALGCGATMFAGEHEALTFDFQHGLPVPAKRFFATNFFFGTMSTAALLVVMLISAVLFSSVPAWISHVSPAEMPEKMWPTLLGLWGVSILELFAWSILFSLLLKRPLVAAMLGVGVASIAAQLASGYTGFSIDPYVQAFPIRLTIAAAVLLLDVFLGFRWFRGYTLFRRSSRPATAVAIGFAPDETKKNFRFFHTTIRLAWQQLRESVWMWLAIAIFSLFIMYFYFYYLKFDLQIWDGARSVLLIFLIAAISLLGIYVFYPDQHGRLYRFSAERGMPAGRFWIGRQITGLAFLGFLGILLYLILVLPLNLQHYMFFTPTWQYRNLVYSGQLFAIAYYSTNDFLLLMYHLLLIYSIGQCMAMFIRSGILAAVAAIFVSALFVLWTSLMIFWHVPLYWSVLPWPILFLAASRLRTSDWLLERRQLHTWLRPASMLVPMAALVVAMPLYRVYSVPDVDPGFSVEEFWQSRKATPAALETVAMYEKAYNILEEYERSLPPPVIEPRQEDEPTEKPPVPWQPVKPLTEKELAEIKAVRPALEMAMEASKRPECDFYADFPHRGMYSQNTSSHAEWLIRPMIFQARQFQSEGKLDDALDYYLAALRMKKQLDFRNPYSSWYGGESSSVYECLPGWAAAPGQTPDRIARALKELQKLPPSIDAISYAIEGNCLSDRGILLDDPKFIDSVESDINSRSNQHYKEQISQFELWKRFLPWERYRALRMLKEITRSNLQQVASVAHKLENNERVGIREDYYYYNNREPDFALIHAINLPRIQQNTWGLHHEIDSFVCNVTIYRAAQIALALEAWKLENGKYPAKLNDLVGKYFEELPIDPISGKSFRYFPEGVPEQLKEIAVWNRYGYTTPKIYLEANTPFLWSPGENLCDQGTDEPPLVRYSLCRYHTGNSDLHGEEDIWRRGFVFPLP